MQTQGYAATAADASLTPYTFERRALRPNDVAIAIDYCGICHSDLHIARNEWGFTSYPIVLGHEIIGRVIDVGTDVTGFAAGDRVGVGCMVDSCKACHPCNAGIEQYCENGFTATSHGPDGQGGVTQGGFSDRIVVREEFVLRLPDGLDPAAAAPLLCAGITTWSPLRHWKVGAGSKVGIVGLGGLGHIAVKLAKGLGAQVVVFTTSAGKIDEARALGADDVIVASDQDALAAHAKSFDVILNTVSAPMDLNPHIGLLRLDGAMVMLGAPAGSHAAPIMYLLESHRRSIAGSIIGGIAETQELLDFCANKGIACDVEVVPPEEINTAFARLDRGDVKFRFVLDMRPAA